MRGAAPPVAADTLRLRIDAQIASIRADYPACAASYERVAELDARATEELYDAAACHAQARAADAAFRDLVRAVDRGYHDVDLMQADPDLASLHDDPRWAELAHRTQARLEAYLPTVNGELYRIVTDDQKARLLADWSTMDLQAFAARDAERLHRVKEILQAGGAKVADDYFSAALVAQHGEGPDDYRLARTLALKAAELDPGNRLARWLAAAATDRELVNLGKPQRYGTQTQAGRDEIFHMPAVDPAVTDAERAQWNVPPLGELQRRMAAMNARNAKNAAPH